MAEEAVDDFRSSLADLTFNSKPLINMLTMLAEENAQYAEQIVRVIEEHIVQVKNYDYTVFQTCRIGLYYIENQETVLGEPRCSIQ